MRKILIDTSVIIDFLRSKEKNKTLLSKIVGAGYLPLTSLITHCELYSGKSVWEKRKAKEDLEKLLSGIEILIPNAEVSELAGKIRALHGINLIDAIIAAEATSSNLPLATLNTKDFRKVKNLHFFIRNLTSPSFPHKIPS